IKIGSAASSESVSAEKTKRQHADLANAIPAGGAESPHWRYLWTIIACIATAMAATPMQPYLDLANIVMLFLLVEVLIAIRFGRGPAIMAAFLSVALFDFFFVPPRLSFAVGDIQYLIT